MTKKPKLSRQRIIDFANALIGREGSKAFTMRKLASELGVDPMAIYHHFENKAELVHAILETVFQDFELPEPGDDWRDDLRLLSTFFRRLAKRHRGAFQIYSYYREWLVGEFGVYDAYYQILGSAGFSRKRTVSATRVLITYSENFAYEEVEGWLDRSDKPELLESPISVMHRRRGIYQKSL